MAVRVIRDERYLEHRPGSEHPESPKRLRSVYRMIEKDFPDADLYLEPDLATLEQLELVHAPSYVRQILDTSEREFTTLTPDTAVSAKSYLSAWLAVGGCLKGLEALMAGQCRACFCLARPPGHHALPDRASGFCIFNNLGVTARYALEQYGLKRILIVDWDIHHGNALQNLFYSESAVLYFSSHYMGWFPHTGDWDETGQGEGEGYTVNLPVFKELGDADMMHLYGELLVPVVQRYKPELILVAAGFDGHHRDPLGRTRLTESCFGWLTQLLVQLSDSVNAAP
ncbi:MAG: histone deacetylase, partial [Deltaproteobacteria bacterium]|nr:histone deacetylase [Deltaproteobacteria bacterium]